MLIHALLFFTAQPEIVFDSASYMTQAESIATSGAARNDVGDPDTVRTPGYPLFLAAFLVLPSAGYTAAVAAQHLLWICVVAVTTWLAFALTRRTTVAMFAGVVTAVDLPALQAAHSIVTEVLATVFVCLAVWHAYRAATAGSVRHAIVAGVMGGVAAIVRPVAILIGVPLALAVLLSGSRPVRARLAALLVVSSLVLPGLWTARNYVQAGVATFSSISSINMLLFRAAGTLAIRDPGGVDANLQRRQAELEAIACHAAESRFGRPCEEIPIAQRATLYTRLALPILMADPLGVVMQAARAFAMIMFGGGADLLSRIAGISASSARAIALIYTLPLAVFAVIGAGYWRRINPAAAWLIMLTMAYLVVMSLGVEAYSRFRVPFLPLYAMLAGGGAAALADRWTRPSPMK